MWGEFKTPAGSCHQCPQAIIKKTSSLQGIRERTRPLNGRVRIESAPGEGARIFVELPLDSVPEEAVITNDRSIE